MPPLLETKLHVPRPRLGTVGRPRLLGGLARTGQARLALVSAPAGSGKTTLLAEWVSSRESPPPGWVSLDAGDNEPATFWAYVIAALRRSAPALADRLDLLPQDQPTPEGALTALINDLSTISDPVTLILDDYHVIHSPEVQAAVAFFVDHLPQHVTVVIATRADPPLPVARLRARGELVEIRAADLRFTEGEAGAYLAGMGLALTSRDVAVLEERTEGWIAALQLAALSLQSRGDVAGFIAGFAGSDRYIVDYLVEEVLDAQTEEVRGFLLQTSVLSRLTGPLCDAVTGTHGGTAMLERLDRANLFTVPLDDQRRWYRYHHLFADVLHVRLLDEQPERVANLHRRACEWWEQAGDQAEAVRHAVAGGDNERAADLVETALPELSRRRQEQTMREWLDAIPDHLYETRPVLAIGFVGSRLVSGDLDRVEMRLRQAERWIGDGGEAPATGMVVRDGEAFRRLPGSIAVYRAALAFSAGDIDGTIDQARRALHLIDEGDHLERGGAAGFLALAHWSRGELDDAYRGWSTTAKALVAAGHLSDVLGCHIALADILIEQGRLHQAARTYQRGLDLASGTPGVRGVADMHVGLARLSLEWNDLAAAREHLQAADALGAAAGLAQNAYRPRVVRARLCSAEGGLDAALALLDEAERLYTSDYYPEVRPIPALRARVWIRQGNRRRVEDWIEDRGLSIEDEPGYMREFEHITLAMALLAAGHRGPQIDRFLERLLAEAEGGGRTGHVIEILVLRAIARADVDPAATRETLHRAMALAEPEGYVRLFVDHALGLAPVLIAAGGSSSYARILAAAAGGASEASPLVVPLTERELEVLRLLSSDLSGPEIARRLFISLNTLRTHTKSIYTKLDAGSRRAALRRAAELGLLPRT